jgi:hypothetical protein
MHSPLSHEAWVVLAGAQGTPQLPQSVAVVSGVSQPVALFASQLSYRGSQVTISQVLVAQVVVACGKVHPTSHLPQSDRLLRLFSQPSEGDWLQSSQPSSHWNWQVLPVHNGRAWSPVGHSWRHVPQFRTSVSTSTQAPPHSTALAAQLGTQTEPVVGSNWHSGTSAGHSLPHVPQLDELTRFVSHPFNSLPSQSSKPGSQVSTQSPPWQTVMA